MCVCVCVFSECVCVCVCVCVCSLSVCVSAGLRVSGCMRTACVLSHGASVTDEPGTPVQLDPARGSGQLGHLKERRGACAGQLGELSW